MKYHPDTIKRINAAEKAGFTIIENADWRWGSRHCRKGKVVRIAQTNHRYSGRPTRVIWALWEKTKPMPEQTAWWPKDHYMLSVPR